MARASAAKRSKKKRTPPGCALTGLPLGEGARATWEEALEGALSRGAPAVLVLIDIDEFSRHHDELGRDRADALLKAFVGRLSESLHTDSLGRLAGDLFGAVLEDIELEEALPILDDARTAVTKTPLRVGRGARKRKVEIGFSAGLASLRRDGATLRALLEQAQAALWRAKSLGGNRSGLPGRERMMLKTSYYPHNQLAKLKTLAVRTGLKESVLLREALDDLFLKHKSRVQTG